MFAKSNHLFNGSKNLLKRFASTNATVPTYKLVVIGGGTGGLAVSSTLSKILGQNEIAIIEPSDVHYYQPLWTFVGAGVKTLADSAKPTEELIPKDAYWIKNKVAKVQPDNKLIELTDGQKIGYDYLVVATGLECHWNKIRGLPETLGKDGVTSNYSTDTVETTWKFIREFKGGNAIFTMPSTPIKCPGAAIKVAYLAEDTFTKNRVRNKSNVIYNSAMGKIFSIDKYAKSLERVAKERGIEVNLGTELKEIRSQQKEAVFDCKGTEKVFNYDLLHVTPPMGPPSFIGESGLGNKQGYVDVDKYTLQHVKYPNIFSLGDSSSAPTSKTAAAISVQSGVLKKNLLDAMTGIFDPHTAAKYDGYASCPLLVGRDKLILAEFSGYTGLPLETFPIDQGQERSFMYWLTKEVIPEIYWNGLLKGTWTGPQRFRNFFSYLP
ncbi:FAD/NAD(P)-binding domain-containing protein [Rhizophagus irregularis]|uniref:Sulfide:quinone oxidoreductase, mitochondrial n=1 Tax=Rhizophagus irregularis TaxID=588596 RepID=A0A2I1G6K0_9GLOM|nr:FAD/NAD(P)-binding domain-containing protein [Rhizophagus irregularis]